MTILVTGAPGFIGSAFCEVAEDVGHDLIKWNREWTSSVVFDCVYWETINAVVHLAAAGVNYGAPDRTWATCIDVNHLATVALLETILESGATPTIFIPGSIRELETATTPHYWRDPYIVTKKISALYVAEFAARYRGRVLRPILGRCKGPGELAPVVAGILEAITA